MKATASELLRQLPGKVTEEWPVGERFIRNGHGVMVNAGTRYTFAPGDCFFVAAGAEHRFVDFSPASVPGRCSGDPETASPVSELGLQ